MKSYKNKNYEQALIETYIKFDELLKLEKINNFLKKYSERKIRNNISRNNIVGLDVNMELSMEENNSNVGNKENFNGIIKINGCGIEEKKENKNESVFIEEKNLNFENCMKENQDIDKGKLKKKYFIGKFFENI